MNTDISRVRFGEDIIWGWKDEFKIRDEREIENQIKKSRLARNFHLRSIFAVYRNLRENYEYRMRYDEVGDFFIREMEMKRKYKQIDSKQKDEKPVIVHNKWIVRHFSLTGLYYHLARYGESFSRPALFGIVIVIFSTLLWLTQPNPATDFSFQSITIPQIVTIPEMDNKTNIQ